MGNHWKNEARGDLVSLIPPGTRTVLDVGCNKGATLTMLRDKGYTAIGIDIEDAREESKDVLFRKEDLGRAKLVTAHFGSPVDCALLGDVLEHIADTETALKNIYTVLSTFNGTIIVSVPNIGWIECVEAISAQDFPRQDNGHFDRTHLRWFTRRVLIEELEKAGFTDIKTYAKYLPNGHPPWPEGKEKADVVFNNLLIRNLNKKQFDELFAYQWIATGVKK